MQINAGKRVVEVDLDLFFGHTDDHAVELLTSLVPHDDDLALGHHRIIQAFLIHELGLGQHGERPFHLGPVGFVGGDRQFELVAHASGRHCGLEVLENLIGTRLKREGLLRNCGLNDLSLRAISAQGVMNRVFHGVLFCVLRGAKDRTMASTSRRYSRFPK